MQSVFKGLHIRFEPAHAVHALIGSSGAGKTTLLNLLARLYEPTGGSIRLDGQDVNQMTRETFLSQIAVVEQQPKVFSRTVWENITYETAFTSSSLSRS